MSELDAIRLRTEDKKKKLEEIRRKKAEREQAAKNTAQPDVVAVTTAPNPENLIKTVDALLSSHANASNVPDNSS